MYSLKDKVSDKLSYLFSDSPHQHQPQQTRQHNKEGRSLASIFSYILPSASSNGSQLNHHQHVIKPIQSHPVRWKDKSFSRKDIPSENYVMAQTSDDEEAFGTPKATDDQGSGRSTSGSDTFEDVTDSRSFKKSMSKLIQDSFFISTDLYEFLKSSLPNIVKGCEWVLLYSTAKHGISLRTLIRKSADLPGPILLIAGDTQGAVFGGMLEGPLKPTAKRKYQGTNQTFVFTTICGEPRLFRPTGANRFFYLCLNDLLALGGGGNFALRLDGDLLSGTSGPCDTFGNLCLAHNQEFELKNVELWAFTHSSKYLL